VKRKSQGEHNMSTETAGMHIPTVEESPTIPLWPTAGQAIGLQRTATFEGHKRGTLPFPVIQAGGPGGKLQVPTAALRRLLELDGQAS
jgi:hypothetical protein